MPARCGTGSTSPPARSGRPAAGTRARTAADVEGDTVRRAEVRQPAELRLETRIQGDAAEPTRLPGSRDATAAANVVIPAATSIRASSRSWSSAETFRPEDGSSCGTPSTTGYLRRSRVVQGPALVLGQQRQRALVERTGQQGEQGVVGGHRGLLGVGGSDGGRRSGTGRAVVRRGGGRRVVARHGQQDRERERVPPTRSATSSGSSGSDSPNASVPRTAVNTQVTVVHTGTMRRPGSAGAPPGT